MTTENSFVQPAVSEFDGNYDHWVILMENFFAFKGVLELGGEWYSYCSKRSHRCLEEEY